MGSYSHLGEKNIQYNAVGGIRVLENNINNLKFAHGPSAKFIVNYDLCHNESSSNIRLPVIDNDFFSFYSPNTLLYPNIDSQKKINITFDFSSLPKDHKVFSSFGEGNIINVNKKIADAFFSQFIAGNVNPSIINIANKKIYLVEHGTWSFFNKRSAHSLIKDLINYQRTQMQDDNFPYYLVTLIKQSDKVAFKTISGIHAKNSLSLTFPDGPQEKFTRVLYILSHELFHNWIGSKMEIPVALRNEYRWFFEGFTDYLALKMAKEGGFIDDAQFLQILNLHIEDYYSSVLHTMPNALYGKLNNIGDISFNFIQTRGHLLALIFAEMLQKKGLDDNTIQLFVTHLIQESSKKDNQLTPEVFWNTFDHYFDNDFKVLVNKHIHEGEEISLPSLKGFNITKKIIEVVDPGFDLVNTIDTGKVIGKHKKSPAFQAGLFEGANFKAYRVIENGGNKELLIIIQQDKVMKQIAYKPKLIKKKISLYALEAPQ